MSTTAEFIKSMGGLAEMERMLDAYNRPKTIISLVKDKYPNTIINNNCITL